MEHEKYMREAIRQAKKAEALGEVPIGCVIVCGDKIIARGYNRRNTDKNTLSHAELNAIRRASKKLGDWRLEGCTLYVTLEPCQMCAGAIVQARVDRVVIGSMNPKAGCAGSILNPLRSSSLIIRWRLCGECWRKSAVLCFPAFSGNCGSRKRRKNWKTLRGKPVDGSRKRHYNANGKEMYPSG